MIVTFIVGAPRPRALTLRGAGALANADVVAGHAELVAPLSGSIGPNAAIIRFPSASAAELEAAFAGVVARHGDPDASIVLVEASVPTAPGAELTRELARRGADFEVVRGLYDEGVESSVPLPREGPLAGMSVVVCRARHQAEPLADALLVAGAVPIAVPVIDVRIRTDLDRDIGALAGAQWVVFSSQNAVRAAATSIAARRLIAGARVCCVGPATAAACASAGFAVDFQPSESRADAVVAEFPGPRGDRARVAFLAGDRARPIIDEGLRARGYEVTRVTAYSTVVVSITDTERNRARGADAIVLTSPSTVEGAVAAFEGVGMPRAVSLGPTTSRALRAHGVEVAAEATTQRLGAAVAALAGLVP